MSSPKYDSKSAEWWGPLGEGGRQMEAIDSRKSLLSSMTGKNSRLQQNASSAADMLSRNASDPGFGASADVARRTIAGDFLSGSPQLNNQLKSIQDQAERSAADVAAASRSGRSRAGIGFSTANDQSDQGMRAAARAGARDTAAAVMADNYKRERVNQVLGGDRLQSALSTPAAMLQQANVALLDPEARQIQNLMALYANGGLANPQLIKKPGTMDEISQGVGIFGNIMGAI